MERMAVARNCPKCHRDNPETQKFCGECGTLLPLTEDQHPLVTETVRTPVKELSRGALFARRFEIIEELGKGGMGRVYRVFDKKTEEEVALKLIKPEIAAEREVIDRFRDELKISRKISHRNVSRMYDLGEEEGTSYITMEYVPGEDLKSFIHRSKQLSVGTAISIAKQVCEGLEEAHRLGIIHRDLKPGNIMIDKEGNARIMDFGIARLLRGKGITNAGVMIGTPQYMSPEQVEGKDVDQRSDIYSLGIILYEMATGQVPFEGDTPFTIGIKHKSERPKNPKDHNAQIPDDLGRLILKCLEKEKEQRYQSAAEVHAELGKIEKGIPTTEREIPRKKPLTSKEITVKLRLQKLLFPGVGIIVLAGIALVVFRLLPRRPPAPLISGKPSLAILYFENISGDKILDAWKTGLTELLITKLGQSRFIRVLDGNTIYSLLKRLNLDEARKYAKEDLLKIANEGGAEYTLSGSLMKAGQNILITLSLQKPRTGEVISPISVECKGEEEIIPKVDEVARKVKSDLDLSSEQIARDFDKEAGKITTISPEAFKYYSEGRKSHSQGDYQKSIELMQKAVKLDPEFAMAYRSMGSAYGNLGQAMERREYYQKALEFKERVSERERYSIEGDFYRQSEKTMTRAIGAYQRLLELYPDDSIGNTNLGVLYSDIEEWDKAIELYRVLAESGTGDVIPVGNLAEAYEAKGQYDAAEEVLKRYLLTNHENEAILSQLARIYAWEGKFDLALQEILKAISLNPRNFQYSWVRAGIYFLKGDLAAADQEARTFMQNENPAAKLLAGEALVRLHFYRGRFGEAKEIAQRGLDLARQVNDNSSAAKILMILSTINEFVYKNFDGALQQLDEASRLAVKSEDAHMQRSILLARGRIYIEKKSVAAAGRVAAELKEMCEKAVSKKQIRLYYELQARIELELKDYPGALDYIRRMISLSPSPGGNDLLADALDSSGDKSQALEEYRKLTASPWVKYNNVGSYVVSFYKLGRISEDMGLKDEAIRYYEQFLDIWKNAEPGAPFVQEARKSLAGLKGT